VHKTAPGGSAALHTGAARAALGTNTTKIAIRSAKPRILRELIAYPPSGSAYAPAPIISS
jgi:hypothetical protein